MITSSGVICDVCGEYVLLDAVQMFSVTGMDRMAHCHATGCKQALVAASDDWQLLPAGPLRTAFEEATE